MSCENFQVLLNRDLDGILGPEDGARLSAHLAACPRCSRDQASLHAMRGAFRDLRRVDVPEGLAGRIAGAASAPREGVLRMPRFALIPAAASVLALCLISGALGWRLNEPGEVRAQHRLDDAAFERVCNELRLTGTQVEAIRAVRSSFDQRIAAEEADLKARKEKLHREEIEAIWNLLPREVQEEHPALRPR
jgi:predicted anti-sigma-YlaC factor YlaD